MLIDASHPEESRVAILNDNRLEEFDFETTTKKQLKGNIYLAKVVRIEPSLQAAFVEFGGNRHGFLAFNEIHPDYYRIPVEDREAILAQHKEEAILSMEELGDDSSPSKEVEILGGEDIVEEVQQRVPRTSPLRQYKIQEVIKRRQIMLVQVTKEERGGKGAALTTFLSLAGRYCVLMPNAAKGGGISRKITNVTDRKRLREIIDSLELPESMSLIIRTAGMARSKIEIKKDCDYLTDLWNEIREKTLHSIAPSLIYEESDLIKRAIRDYYRRDIEEIFIEGEEGYKEAKEFIRKLMPSHAKKIKKYKDDKLPLFYRYGVEQQIDAMHNPVVQLKSGGYIVFGTTEALIAIDVNSGKATRERHIEETAYKTNLEAAEEVARQLQLRDLAGLIVIDFIDMEENRNIEAVERRLKDAMRQDRARVQVGHISPFGLLELSRQRLRPNIIESTSLPCPSCRGSGMVRSVESSSLHVLRCLEEEAIQQKSGEVTVYLPTPIILYLLNQKRKAIQDIESRWGLLVHFAQDDSLIPPDYRIERLKIRKDAAAEREKTPSQEEGRETRSTPLANRGPSQKERFRGKRHQNRPKPQEAPSAPRPSGEGAQENKSLPAEDQPQSEAQKKARPQQRRYRKFDRRQRPKREEGKEGSPLSQDATPAAASPTAPQKAREPHSSPKGGDKAAKSDEATAAAPERKKSASRKGWWQRLLD